MYELTLTRALEFIRVPEAMFWVFVFPVALALALGFAFREKGPDRIPVGVLEGPGAAELVRALEESPSLAPRVLSREEAETALRRGRITLVVEQEGDRVTYRFDPSRPESRSVRLDVDDAVQRRAGRRDPVPVSERHIRERGSRYIDFLIPGLLGMNLMGTGMWSVGFSIATARMQNLLKRLVATPMRKGEYLAAQMLSRLIFLVPEVVLLILFAWLMFGVQVRGSVLLLSVVCLLGAFTFSGFGLLVASRAQTIEGVSGLMNLVMVPMWIGSGIFFSAERFPDFAQPFVQALPLTALNDALRSVMNEAATVREIAPEMLNMTIWGVASFLVALRIFRWR